MAHTCNSSIPYAESSGADPHRFDADPDPAFQCHKDPDPTSLFCSDLDPPMLQNDPLRLPPFHSDADPYPAFHFDADPDSALPKPASQNNADPQHCRIGIGSGLFLAAGYRSLYSFKSKFKRFKGSK